MIQYQKKYQTLLNGEKIAYIEKGSNNNVILLLHGNLATSVHMVTLIDQLKNKYRVIAPDLRGYGDSSYNNTFMSLTELAFDMMLLLKELNIENAHVIGWSTGFGVAMELAILAPALVKSLFSIQGMPVKGYYSLSKNKEGEQLSNRVYQSYQDMKKDDELMLVHSKIITKNYKFIKNVWEKLLLRNKEIDNDLLNLYINETLKQKNQDVINWCWVNYNISDEENLYSKGSSKMHLIKCPIHLTLSLDDNIVSKEVVLENIKLLNKAIVHEIKNAGHFVHFDKLDEISSIIINNLK